MKSSYESKLRYGLWGHVQSRGKIADGIMRVSTASHGGYVLNDARLAEMPEPLRKLADQGHFEEDCAWCAVVLSFQHLFSPSIVMEAKDTCKQWFPEAWEAWTGKTLKPGESRTKDSKVWHETHKDRYIVVSAWGDWHEQVPKGMVGVRAIRGGRKPLTAENFNRTDDEADFLVPAEEYDKRSPHGFLIDEARHKRIAALV